jgi:hypothetical protein
MLYRVGFRAAAAVALTAAGLMTASTLPAAADLSWSEAMILRATPYLPAQQWRDGRDSHASFGAYMWQSGLIPPPVMSIASNLPLKTVDLAYAPAFATEVVVTPTVGTHVAWCQAHFRSYSAATDSYRGYDGLAHRCIAPY